MHLVTRAAGNDHVIWPFQKTCCTVLPFLLATWLRHSSSTRFLVLPTRKGRCILRTRFSPTELLARLVFNEPNLPIAMAWHGPSTSSTCIATVYLKTAEGVKLGADYPLRALISESISLRGCSFV